MVYCFVFRHAPLLNSLFYVVAFDEFRSLIGMSLDFRCCLWSLVFLFSINGDEQLLIVTDARSHG